MDKNVMAEKLTRKYREWKISSMNEGGYFLIFKGFMDGNLLSNLSGNAVKLYIFLGLYSKNETGECWPGIDRMAKYFDRKERTIYLWLNELEKNGLIKRLQFQYNGPTYTYLRPYPHSRKR